MYRSSSPHKIADGLMSFSGALCAMGLKANHAGRRAGRQADERQRHSTGIAKVNSPSSVGVCLLRFDFVVNRKHFDFHGKGNGFSKGWAGERH